MKIISKLAVLAAVGAIVGTIANGQPTSALTEWQPSYASEFDGNSLDNTNWSILSRTAYGNNSLLYSPSNISVANGLLTIATQRHCVSDPSIAPNASNVHEEACPAGQTTKYSSGRIQSDAFIDGSKPFKVEIKAKIDWNDTIGTRPALWMVNGVSYCNTTDSEPLGELDILEWYARSPESSYSTSHMTCNKDTAGKVTTRSFSHRETAAQSLADTWHTWTVEYDGTTIRYLLDGSPVNVTSKNLNGVTQQTPNYGPTENNADLGLTPQDTQNIMNRNWLLIINDFIETIAGPDETTSFPVQHFSVDYVRVFTEAVPAPQTPDNPQSSTNTPTPMQPAPATGEQLAQTGSPFNSPLTTGIITTIAGIAFLTEYTSRKHY